MKRLIGLLALMATFTAVLSLSVSSIAGAGGSARYIVVLKDSADPDATARDHGRSYGADVSRTVRH